jgi:hypothetical protein
MRQTDESTEVSEEPAGQYLAVEAAATSLQVHANFALVSASEPAPDDAHGAGEGRAGDTEAEGASAIDDEHASDGERASLTEGADEIVVVGGARPPIDEPGPHDILQHEREEAGTASVAGAPSSSGDVDDARREPAATNGAEIAVVGEARPPLDDADEEPADLGQPLQGAIAEPSDAARAIEPEPACQGQQSAGVPQLDDRQPLPVSSDAEAVPALPGEARPASEEARRTDVVRVGEGEDHGGEDARRRGWWQRLLS